MSIVVRVEHVTKRYRRGREVVTAVDDASFELDAGVLTALVGPSGSGKTTLLNILVGGDDPDEGHVVGLGDRPDWSQLAVVPQALGLLPELTMGENVDLPRRLGTAVADRAVDVMGRLGIAQLTDRSPSETSLGEQQRASVARALIASPVMLVADEPTSHQDDANTRRVVASLVELAAAGTSVLLATHDHRVLEECDRVLRMADGVVTEP